MANPLNPIYMGMQFVDRQGRLTPQAALALEQWRDQYVGRPRIIPCSAEGREVTADEIGATNPPVLPGNAIYTLITLRPLDGGCVIQDYTMGETYSFIGPTWETTNPTYFGHLFQVIPQKFGPSKTTLFSAAENTLLYTAKPSEAGSLGLGSITNRFGYNQGNNGGRHLYLSVMPQLEDFRTFFFALTIGFYTFIEESNANTDGGVQPVQGVLWET